MLFVYILTLFLSAALLFFVEPMFAKMMLPRFGGSPSVWNTAVLFYQVTLLIAYIYAHYGLKFLGLKRQAVIHMLFLLFPLAFLPIEVSELSAFSAASQPIASVLLILTKSVGLPFFVISITAPMLQKWFEASGHSRAKDPYFLYAASNMGSMVALLSYPFAVELFVPLSLQSRYWSMLYILLIFLTFICFWNVFWSTSFASDHKSDFSMDREENVAADICWKRKVYWIFLAFVPSSLMIAVPTYFADEVTPIPLFWVLPLAVYLLTFILAFAKTQLISMTFCQRAFPVSLLLLALMIIFKKNSPLMLILAIHIWTLFLVGMICHGALAKDRPPARFLTDFYLWLSVGGALGGVFNALIAPLVFNSIAEYPIVLSLACLALPKREELSKIDSIRGFSREIRLPLSLGAFLVVALVMNRYFMFDERGFAVLLMSIATVCSGAFWYYPLRFALSVGVLFSVGANLKLDSDSLLYAERSFFGVNRVSVDSLQERIKLYHGNTLHGLQNVDSANRDSPLLYYYPTGPIGQLFERLKPFSVGWKVGVVGLGAGSLAYYRQTEQSWTFFEIDEEVVRIAQDPAFFTFLQKNPANIVVGDARLALENEPDSKYNLIIVDAYSGDSIPVHLTTREAINLYLKKVNQDGIVAFHISNRHLDLEPIIASFVDDEKLFGVVREELTIDKNEASYGKKGSIWALVTRRSTNLDNFISRSEWRLLQGQSTFKVWTDDYSSVMSVMRWR